MAMEPSLTRGDFYYWRLFSTGLCFLFVGLGGLLLGVAVPALLRLFVWNRARRGRYVRNVVHLGVRLSLALMRGLGVLTLDVRGRSRLNDRAQLIVANHPSLLDIVLLIAMVPNAAVMVKQPLLNGLPFGPLLRGAGYIGNRDAEASLAGCVEALNVGASVILFPEGTRTPRDTPARLHRGAAHVAIAADAPIVPVNILCTPPTLAKTDRWYNIPNRRVHYELDIGEPIDTRGSTPLESRPARARRITERIRSQLMEHGAHVWMKSSTT